ncbi:MAG: hypothetical protein HUK02_02095 [Bacteroidaceae bacterium]|nr:hypothetical protein [Bacteroidaceae bacterium]
MRKLITLLVFTLSAAAFAQSNGVCCEKTSTTGGRFEVIQSPIDRQLTLKLDKQTGTVWMAAAANNQEALNWYELPRQYAIEKDTKKPNAINYQIFIGGHNIKDCILTNIHTGLSWRLIRLEVGGNGWVLMDEHGLPE